MRQVYYSHDLAAQIVALETLQLQNGQLAKDLETAKADAQTQHDEMQTELDEVQADHVAFIDDIIDGCLPYPDGQGGYVFNTETATCVDARVLAMSSQGCRTLAGKRVTIEIVDPEGGYIVWSPESELNLWSDAHQEDGKIPLYPLVGLPANLLTYADHLLPHWSPLIALDWGTIIIGYRLLLHDRTELIEAHPVDGLYPWSADLVHVTQQDHYAEKMSQIFQRVTDFVEDDLSNPHCPGF